MPEPLRARATGRGTAELLRRASGQGVVGVGGDGGASRWVADDPGQAKIELGTLADAIVPRRTPARVCHAWRKQDVPHPGATGAHAQGAGPAPEAAHPPRAFRALRDISFDVRRGEFFGVAGRNGSGKSTLLKCLAGIYGVRQGESGVNGRLSTFIELGVGFNADLAAQGERRPERDHDGPLAARSRKRATTA